MSKSSRAYHGLTGAELMGELDASTFTGFIIFSSSNKQWKGATKLVAQHGQLLEMEAEMATKLAERQAEISEVEDWVHSGQPFTKELIEASREERTDGVVLCWKDTEKNGYTAQGCPKCGRAVRYGWGTSKQHSRSKACRTRFEELFREAPEDKHRVDDAASKQNRWLVEHVREADTPASGGVEEPPVEEHPGIPPLQEILDIPDNP